MIYHDIMIIIIATLIKITIFWNDLQIWRQGGLGGSVPCVSNKWQPPALSSSSSSSSSTATPASSSSLSLSCLKRNQQEEPHILLVNCKFSWFDGRQKTEQHLLLFIWAKAAAAYVLNCRRSHLTCTGRTRTSRDILVHSKICDIKLICLTCFVFVTKCSRKASKTESQNFYARGHP